MKTIPEQIQALGSDLVEWRRQFHQIPETALQETKTASIIAEKLSSWGLEVQTGVGKTGVVGILKGQSKGKTLGIRVDIDALPVTEETGHSFASKHPGVMHACGHDGHITIGLGTARILSLNRGLLKGTVVFFFQPAEETLNGAQAMLDSGILKEIKLDGIVGLHIWPDFPLGTVAVQSGPVMAAVDRFFVEVVGKGGHGAMPQKSIDPIVLASQVVLAFQTLVSREIDPLKPAVVTIGRIQGGTTFNVIPDKVELEGTVRTFDSEVREFLPKRMEQILKGITEGARGSYTFQYEYGIPAVINDEQLATRIQGVIQKCLGKDQVITKILPSMGGEDFSLFQKEAPGVYLFLGTHNPDLPSYPLHHAKYTLDERVLPLGVRVFSEIALDFLTEFEFATE
ncbi:MAG: M20 family metallopeptidase [Spirochaetales bacterium]